MAKKSSTKSAKKNRGKIVIDRRRWLTGEVSEKLGIESSLLDHDSNMMCCLGFVCRQIGLSRQDILGRTAPYEVFDALRYKSLPSTEKTRNILKASGLIWAGNSTKMCSRMIAVNDSYDLTRDEREALIGAGLSKLGYRIEFKGKYPKALDAHA